MISMKTINIIQIKKRKLSYKSVQQGFQGGANGALAPPLYPPLLLKKQPKNLLNVNFFQIFLLYLHIKCPKKQVKQSFFECILMVKLILKGTIFFTKTSQKLLCFDFINFCSPSNNC
eukprot:TRINITY_DN12252_c1_g1_i2.p3 TRINITY_DN12252_c1_g1~~TRINITY_DN12252_c1_g1_i2.p3  ORF type:complete len:117 (+),score=7.10 TRINITY_DN12252_c1_g1_i2:672-1022(+)